MKATNVEEGSPPSGGNYDRADAEADLRSYYSRKRSVCVSSLLLVLPFAALAAIRAPILGIDLLLGVLCGIAYALLTMRATEQVVDSRASLGAYRRSGVLRVFTFGAVPAVTAAFGPWWGMGLYFAGFFTPMALYALRVRREIEQAT